MWNVSSQEHGQTKQTEKAMKRTIINSILLQSVVLVLWLSTLTGYFEVYHGEWMNGCSKGVLRYNPHKILFKIQYKPWARSFKYILTFNFTNNFHRTKFCIKNYFLIRKQSSDLCQLRMVYNWIKKDNCWSDITVSESLNLCASHKKEIRRSPEITDRHDAELHPVIHGSTDEKKEISERNRPSNHIDRDGMRSS